MHPSSREIITIWQFKTILLIILKNDSKIMNNGKKRSSNLKSLDKESSQGSDKNCSKSLHSCRSAVTTFSENTLSTSAKEVLDKVLLPSISRNAVTFIQSTNQVPVRVTGLCIIGVAEELDPRCDEVARIAVSLRPFSDRRPYQGQGDDEDNGSCDGLHIYIAELKARKSRFL